MLMLNRQIRTGVHTMLPHKHDNVFVKQQNMITGGKRSVSRSLHMGDPVRIINFSKHGKDKWLAGVVTDKHRPLTYLVTLDDNWDLSKGAHHPMIQLSYDSSDPTPLPLNFDELDTPSIDRSCEKPVLAPQHVLSSVTTTPRIQPQASVVQQSFSGQHCLERLTGYHNLRTLDYLLR